MTAPDYADLRRLLAEAIYQGRIANCAKTIKGWESEDDHPLLCRVLRGESEQFVTYLMPVLRPLYLTGSARLTALLDEREALIREWDGLRAKVEALATEWDASTGESCADCDKVRDGLDHLLTFLAVHPATPAESMLSPEAQEVMAEVNRGDLTRMHRLMAEDPLTEADELMSPEQRAALTAETEEIGRVRAQGAASGANYLMGAATPTEFRDHHENSPETQVEAMLRIQAEYEADEAADFATHPEDRP